MNIGVIIQARMGSARRPGKVLHAIAGQPLLQYLVQRIQRCETLPNIVIATSDTVADDVVETFCERCGLVCRRGSLTNVASRLYDVFREFGWDYAVRLSGDSPLLDQRLIQQAVKLAGRSVDLVTNVWPRTFPRGQSVEVIRSATFLDVYQHMRLDEDFEHVTKFFYRNAEQFNIVNFRAQQDYNHIHLAVDTPHDMEIVAGIIAAMDRPHWQYRWEELVPMVRQQRELKDWRAA